MDLNQIGFYLDDANGQLKNYGNLDEAGWKFRPLLQFDAFQEDDRATVLKKSILDQWKDPNNRQDGICFDIFSFEGNLTAMKKSISMILKELEENEGRENDKSITHIH